MLGNTLHVTFVRPDHSLMVSFFLAFSRPRLVLFVYSLIIVTRMTKTESVQDHTRWYQTGSCDKKFAGVILIKHQSRSCK